MNIREAVALEELQKPISKAGSMLSREQMARRIHQIAAAEGNPIDESVSEFAKHWLPSDYFVLREIRASDAAIAGSTNKKLVQRHLHASAASLEPVVVDRNTRKVGQTFKGYVPDVIVVAGRERHTASATNGREFVLAWVGCRAERRVTIRADHDFGAQELQTKLNEALREKICPPKKKDGIKYDSTLVAGPCPWVQEVYPFENYCIYQHDGKMFKQAFTTDDKKRTVTLKGNPVEVIQKYAEIQGRGTRIDAAMLFAAMPSQDVAAPGGSAQHMPMPGMKGGKLYTEKAKDCNCGKMSCEACSGKSMKADKFNSTDKQRVLKPQPEGNHNGRRNGVGPVTQDDGGANKSSQNLGIDADDYVGKLKTKKKSRLEKLKERVTAGGPGSGPRPGQGRKADRSEEYAKFFDNHIKNSSGNPIKALAEKYGYSFGKALDIYNQYKMAQQRKASWGPTGNPSIGPNGARRFKASKKSK